MKKQNTLLILIIPLLGFGCASPMTSIPVPTATQMSLPTWTAFPTASQVPTALPTVVEQPTLRIITPEPPLRTDGPYFAYFRKTNFSPFQFVLMDADGRGRKVIDVPDEVADVPYSQLHARYVSPDGKWLAFYSGSAGDYKELMAPGTFDLTLNLFDLSTGETQVVTPLLSKDYPNNFTKAAKDLNDSYASPAHLQNAFLAGITQALAWSPDGKYLAFAGQMDGLSSDPYLYDMATKKIQRLPGNHEELQWIEWSPDGKWILHGSGLSTELMADYSIYSVSKDNSSFHDLDYGFTFRWLNSHQILKYRMGIETYQLRLVDVATGKAKELWEGSFYGHNVDPTGNWILVNALSSVRLPQEEKPGFVPGMRLINLKSFEKIQIQDQNSDPSSELEHLFVRSKDGAVINLPFTGEMIVASPDTKYWAVVDVQDMKIYTHDLTLVKEITIPLRNERSINAPWRPDDMQWTPDSSGLFLVYGTKICSVNISTGAIDLVETNFTGVYRSTGWINGK